MFSLPDLDYGYDSLSPSISYEIMELHHQKHHQTYIDNLNKALESINNKSTDLESIIKDLDKIPDSVKTTIRNNGGGHFNHSMFWKIMTPNFKEPDSEILDKINSKYNIFDQFKEKFSEAALKIFGSGWTWLMPDMSIVTTPNQDNPIMAGKDKPILGLDVWEHAYYLDYKNKRVDYINNWWKVVNWSEVNNRLKAKK